MEKKVILFQGDSITDCCRDRNNTFDLAKGYPNLVMATLNVDEPYTYTAYNRGISGDRIADLYARIRKDMINLKPDYISILVGINEVWHGYAYDNGADEKKFEMIYGLLIEELQRELPGVKIFMFEPFYLHGSATCSSDATPGRWEYYLREAPLRQATAKRVAEKYGLLFVPMQKLFEEAEATAPHEGYWLYDGVHPTEAGHELLKRQWLKAFAAIKD